QESIKEQLNCLLKERKKFKLLLSQQSKMAFVGEMLPSISHQWKQPLSAIASSTVDTKIKELLKESPDEIVLSNLERIEKQIEFMVSTMHDFNNFFKPDKEKVKFSLIESSYELINLFSKNFIENGVIINLNSNNEQDIEVFGYDNMYKQALINIISNAADAIKENNPDNKNIFVECDSDSEYGIVTITNYAGRIAEENMAKIFNQFFTTKGDRGTGIGLSMTKQIIEELESGKLSVENIEDGVVFTIKLPLN
ncbi:MAG: HAMP domain-containing histidine kinase, partial [Sulfurimonas sp.]|nr:HAMP domain-containing histidine kinase [Sulfurimonas sp.]